MVHIDENPCKSWECNTSWTHELVQTLQSKNKERSSLNAMYSPCAGITFALTLVRMPDIPDMTGKFISQPFSRLALVEVEVEVEIEAEREAQRGMDPLLSQIEVVPLSESFLHMPTPNPLSLSLLCMMAHLSVCGIRSRVLSLKSLEGSPSTIGLFIARKTKSSESIEKTRLETLREYDWKHCMGWKIPIIWRKKSD